MNEDKKELLNLILAFALGIAVTLAIAIPIHISITRRTNNNVRELTDKLATSNQRLAEATLTITDCRIGIERLSRDTEASGTTLSGVINSLKQIRNDVQLLEKRLYCYDYNCGNNNWNNDIFNPPVE